MAELDSSAPHLERASTRTDLAAPGAQPGASAGASHCSARLLFRGPHGQPEAGLRSCTPGRRRLALAHDELCYFLAGRAQYRRDDGERIEIAPATLVLFPLGWSGECTVHETLRSTYMSSAADGAAASAPPATPCLRDPLAQTGLADWGLIPTMLAGASHTSGRLLHKGPEGCNECGLWRCTPGRWACHVTRDEFCHFLAGHSTYVHEGGEVIEIAPDTVAFFPRDWRGVCTVHQTVTKVYLIA